MPMKLPDQVLELISTAEHKALATISAEGPNVVPLSMVHQDGEDIVVCDCFMDKTAKNLSEDGRAALALWKGFAGVQLKGRVRYEAEGDRFNRFVEWLKGKHPERTLRGVLVFEVEKAYDLSPANAGQPLC